MRPIIAIVVIVTLSLAGCLGGTTNDTLPNGTTDEGPVTGATLADILEWEILGCRFVYTSALADAAAVQSSLPEGFTVQTTGPAARAAIGFEANICASGTGLDGYVQNQTYATVWVGATPPDHLAVEEGAFHVVNLDVLIEDEPRRAWMQERGIPAHDGGVTWEDRATGPLITYTLDGVGTFTMDIAESQPVGPGGGGGTFDQWTPGDQGLTYWRTNWAATTAGQGSGTVALPEGSVYADWFEGGVATAQFFYGTWDYTDGRIVHPAPLAEAAIS